MSRLTPPGDSYGLDGLAVTITEHPSLVGNSVSSNVNFGRSARLRPPGRPIPQYSLKDANAYVAIVAAAFGRVEIMIERPEDTTRSHLRANGVKVHPFFLWVLAIPLFIIQLSCIVALRFDLDLEPLSHEVETAKGHGAEEAAESISGLMWRLKLLMVVILQLTQFSEIAETLQFFSLVINPLSWVEIHHPRASEWLSTDVLKKWPTTGTWFFRPTCLAPWCILALLMRFLVGYLVCVDSVSLILSSKTVKDAIFNSLAMTFVTDLNRYWKTFYFLLLHLKLDDSDFWLTKWKHAMESEADAPGAKDCSSGPAGGLTTGLIGAAVAGLIAWKHQAERQRQLGGLQDGGGGPYFVVGWMLLVGSISWALGKLWLGFINLQQLKDLTEDLITEDLRGTSGAEEGGSSVMSSPREAESRLLMSFDPALAKRALAPPARAPHTWTRSVLEAMRRGSDDAPKLACCGGYPIRAKQLERALTSTMLFLIYVQQLCVILFAYKTDILPVARDICTQYRWFEHHADYLWLDAAASWFVVAAQHLVLLDARNATMIRVRDQLNETENTTHGYVKGCEQLHDHPEHDYYRMTWSDRADLFEHLPWWVWLLMVILLLLLVLGPCVGHALHKNMFSAGQSTEDLDNRMDAVEEEETKVRREIDELRKENEEQARKIEALERDRGAGQEDAENICQKIDALLREDQERRREMNLLREDFQAGFRAEIEQAAQIQEQARRIEAQEKILKEQARKIEAVEEARRIEALERDRGAGRQDPSLGRLYSRNHCDNNGSDDDDDNNNRRRL